MDCCSCELLIGLLQLEHTESCAVVFSLSSLPAGGASETLASLVRLDPLLVFSSASSLLAASKLSCLAAVVVVDFDLGHRQFMQTTLRLSLQN